MEISTQPGISDLISELEKPLFRYARSLGLSVHDAEDAAQEGLIRLTRALEKKKKKKIRNPKAYAFTIVRNNASKRFRDKARRAEIEIQDDHPETEPETDKFEEPLLKEAFRAAYANLADEDRILIRRYYLEAWTYDELGAELGCSAQNAWKRVKKIVSGVLAGEVRKVISQADPEFAKELFNS